jgi:hypothetical protein
MQLLSLPHSPRPHPIPSHPHPLHFPSTSPPGPVHAISRRLPSLAFLIPRTPLHHLSLSHPRVSLLRSCGVVLLQELAARDTTHIMKLDDFKRYTTELVKWQNMEKQMKASAAK